MADQTRSRLAREARAQLRMVARFLQSWDPIGVNADLAASGNSPTEYDTYAPGVLELLQRGCTADALEAHLAELRTGLGLEAAGADDRKFALGLLRWWHERGSRVLEP